MCFPGSALLPEGTMLVGQEGMFPSVLARAAVLGTSEERNLTIARAIRSMF